MFNLSRILFALIFVIFVGNFVGSFFGLYWTLQWFDIPMHMLGGAWIAFFGAYLFGERFSLIRFESVRPIITFLLLIGFVALIGIFWEIFEYGIDAFVSQTLSLARPGDMFDTLLDLLDDLVGGAIAILLFLRSSRKRNLVHGVAGEKE